MSKVVQENQERQARMMKSITMIMAVAIFAGNAIARLGETSEEAAKRYGEPLQSQNDTNAIIRSYEKNGIRIYATFFTSGSNACIIGQMNYSIPEGMSQSNSTAMLLQLLEANADGVKLRKEACVMEGDSFRREGFTAFALTARSLTVILDEYFFGVLTKGWARIGETVDETTKRCGEAIESRAENNTNIVTRKYIGRYKNDKVCMIASFFKGKSGESIIGNICYSFPIRQEINKKRVGCPPPPSKNSKANGSNNVAEVTAALPSPVIVDSEDNTVKIRLLLEANAGGQKWADDQDEGLLKITPSQQLHRIGAKASAVFPYRGEMPTLTVTLDEYVDFIASETKRLEAEKAEQLGKQMKDF
jgi:hypothetical protein